MLEWTILSASEDFALSSKKKKKKNIPNWIAILALSTLGSITLDETIRWTSKCFIIV